MVITMGKVAITVNGDKPSNLFPAFILASCAAASGDDVIMYFTPDAAPALKKGVLENMTGKGMPEMSDLLEGVAALDGRLLMCELGLPANDMKEEDLIEEVEICGATTFYVEAQGAALSFSF